LTKKSKKKEGGEWKAISRRNDGSPPSPRGKKERDIPDMEPLGEEE